MVLCFKCKVQYVPLSSAAFCLCFRMPKRPFVYILDILQSFCTMVISPFQTILYFTFSYHWTILHSTMQPQITDTMQPQFTEQSGLVHCVVRISSSCLDMYELISFSICFLKILNPTNLVALQVLDDKI